MQFALMLAILTAFNVAAFTPSAAAQDGCQPALEAAEGARQYALASNARIETYLNNAKDAGQICTPETFRQIDRNIRAVEATAAMAARVRGLCAGTSQKEAGAQLQQVAEYEAVRKHHLRGLFVQSCNFAD